MVAFGIEDGLGRDVGMLYATFVQEPLLVQPTADPLLSSFTDHSLGALLHAAPPFLPLEVLQPEALPHAVHEMP
jgi:hypothetical protein